MFLISKTLSLQCDNNVTIEPNISVTNIAILLLLVSSPISYLQSSFVFHFLCDDHQFRCINQPPIHHTFHLLITSDHRSVPCQVEG